MDFVNDVLKKMHTIELNLSMRFEIKSNSGRRLSNKF